MAGLTCPSCGAEQPTASGATRCYACGSPLADDDLPAPVTRQRPVDLPAPRFGGPDGIDLPAPKLPPPLSPPPLTPPLPPPRSGSPIDDLPAPVSRGDAGHGPPPLPPITHDDLPVPVARSAPPPAMPDLLAPASPLPENLPAPKSAPAPSALPDNLPAPRHPPPLPAPQTRPLGSRLPDNLPAPRAPAPPRPPPLPDNLPAPRGEPANLPTPVGPLPSNLPAPAISDVTPVGPTPSGSLPAPKGFFDDGVLPQRPDGPSTLPAPKGFFDDGVLPQRPDGPSTLPAPKGFFDDGLSPAGAAAQNKSGLPAPKGFFDDIAELGEAGAGPIDLGPAFGDPAPDGPQQAPFDLGEPLDLGAAAASSRPSLDLDGLDLQEPGAPLALEPPLEQRPFGLDGLDLEPPNHDRSASHVDTSPFQDVSLPGAGPPLSPPAGDGVVSFSTPSARALAEGQQAHVRRRHAPSDVPLELDRTALPGELPQGRTIARQEVATADTGSKKRLIAMISILVLLGLGAGGYYGYNKWTAGKQAEQQIARGLEAARSQMKLDSPGHWMAAAKAADRVLAADRKHVEAAALRAQAYFAAVIDTGIQVDARLGQGKRSIDLLRKLAAAGPEVDKAEALMAIVERRLGDALGRLAAARRAAPRDPSIQLFFGWAHAAAHDWDKAAAAFKALLAIAPQHIAARFGLAESLLALGKKDEAREAYAALIVDHRKRFNRDHVGALVGAAQLAEVEKYSERELRYKEILNRKELAKADPRAISKVGALAGLEALRAGRVQEASQLFAAALKLDPANLTAVVGEGEVLYAQGRYDAAHERLSRVRSVDPQNLDAALALAAVAVKKENLTEAKNLLAEIFERKPPVTASAVLARAHRTRARVYAMEPGMLGKVEDEYRKAMELSGERSIAAALELARFLVSQDRADDARQVLDPIRERAATDPSIAVSLGVAYLFAGDPVAAEGSFRAALSQRANDVEARYQLGAALLAQKRDDEGLAAIKSAYDTDRSREDIGVALAVAYEERKRFKDAEALYESLLKGAEPSLNVKARAGRYFARYGSVKRAVALGAEIAAEQPRHPAALYLLGEKEYLANNLADAYRNFLDAAEMEPEAQYFEAAGRAAEGDNLFPDALAAYEKAIAKEPDYLAPRLGSARIYRARRQFTKAIEALDAIIEMAPDNAWAHFARGDSLLQLRKEKEAVAALRRAVNLDPKHAEASYKLGRALYDLDEPRAAAAALARARRHAGADDAWLTECLRLLGYALRQSGKRREAIEALKAYEERNPGDGPTFHDARNLRIYLEGGGR